jgi:hypothetical protein
MTQGGGRAAMVGGRAATTYVRFSLSLHFGAFPTCLLDFWYVHPNIHVHPVELISSNG